MGATPEQVVAAQRDPEALAALCEENAGLVYEAVWRVVGRQPRESVRTDGGLDFDDLLQNAWVGFLAAVKRYDPSVGAAFSTYAIPTMVGEMWRANRVAFPYGIRVPRSAQEAGARPDAVSLDAISPMGDEDGDPFGAIIPGDHDTAEEAIAAVNGSEAMTAASALSPRRRRVLELALAGLNQTEIGERVGTKQVQASRDLKAALRDVAAALGAPPPAGSGVLSPGRRIGIRSPRTACARRAAS